MLEASDCRYGKPLRLPVFHTSKSLPKRSFLPSPAWQQVVASWYAPSCGRADGTPQPPASGEVRLTEVEPFWLNPKDECAIQAWSLALGGPTFPRFPAGKRWPRICGLQGLSRLCWSALRRAGIPRRSWLCSPRSRHRKIVPGCPRLEALVIAIGMCQDAIHCDPIQTRFLLARRKVG